MGLLSGSSRRKLSLSTAVAPPMMILHAEDDAVEVNVASHSRTGDLISQIASKERELLFQKYILEGCRHEIDCLKKQLQGESAPEKRNELIGTAQKFALITKGKKEQFIVSYNEWKEFILKMDLMQSSERREEHEHGLDGHAMS